MSAESQETILESDGSVERPRTPIVVRQVLRNQVKDVILQRIIGGHYPPNSRLVETQIGRELGVSQGSVREALRELESVGLVEYAPFRGSRVRQPSLEELLQAFPVRAALESFAAAEAAARMDAAGFDELEELIQTMERAAREGDGHAHSIANARFHAVIVGAARNPILQRHWEMLEPFARTYLTVANTHVDLLVLARRHQLILQPLRARDAGGAAAAMQQHLNEAAEWLGEKRME